MDTPNEPDVDVLVDRADGVLTLTLNRPNRKNALSRSMVATLKGEVESTARDVPGEPPVRVIVLRASGTDFCTGIDLVESNRRDAGTEQRPRTGHMQRGFGQGAHGLIAALEAVQLPVVAAVRGWAAGIGNALALSADVVIADTSAKFWVPMVPRGFTPDSGNTWLLPRLIGLPRAKHMLLRGKPVDATTAEAWGLIAECVEPDDLDRAVGDVVAELRDAATIAVGLAKTLVHRNLSVDLGAALHNEAIHEELAVRTDDFKEGIRSFAEKRAPRYEGR